MPDLAIDDAVLRCVAPRTKDELWWYCHEQLRVVCEVCKGAGGYWREGATVACEKCGGRGSHGFRLGRVAVCDGTDGRDAHVAPLDVLWELWQGGLQTVLILAAREGGKTRVLAILEHLLARFQRFTISHMGAIEPQAVRARRWLQHQTDGSPADGGFWYDAATKEPTAPGAADAVPELARDAMEKVEWANGAAIEYLPGTMAQASGPHYELSVLDEVDEAKPEVQQKFSQTPSGPRAKLVQASTYSYATGTVSKILHDMPFIPVRRWCVFEAMARCAYDCNAAPLPDGTTGRCPLFETEEIAADGRRHTVPLCGGVKARRSDGHIPISAVILKWMTSSPYSRRVEMLCHRPEMGFGAGLAYWAYAPETDLDFDPPIRLDAPLELSLDFNPSAGKEMSAAIFQQAPAPYAHEWWWVDEIVLPASNTPAVMAEFARRYGIGGMMLPPEHGPHVFPAGVWISGDATGHSPHSATPESDYDVVLRYLKGWPDVRLLVGPGSANPPLITRLERTNQALWDPLTGRRTLRVAPRVVRGRRELAQMPLKPGTREKDKSERMQRLGFTHLGDCLEYWAWGRFGGGVPGVGLAAVAPVAVGRRASADGPGLTRAGTRSSAGYPWAGGRREDR